MINLNCLTRRACQIRGKDFLSGTYVYKSTPFDSPAGGGHRLPIAAVLVNFYELRVGKRHACPPFLFPFLPFSQSLQT
jgi:hypothetical protein